MMISNPEIIINGKILNAVEIQQLKLSLKHERESQLRFMKITKIDYIIPIIELWIKTITEIESKIGE